MSISITIQGKVIDFPSSAESPNNAEAQIAFAQAVEAALAAALSSSDIASQIFNIDNYNVGTIAVPNLTFSISAVRGVIIEYSIYRQTTTANLSEIGTIHADYNPNNPPNQKWVFTRDFVGTSQTSFTISDVGVVSITNTALSGSNHTGQIVYRARSLQSV